MGTTLYQVVHDLHLAIEYFGLAIDIPAQTFQHAFEHNPETIQGRFIGRNIIIQQTQGSVHIHKVSSKKVAPYTLPPIQTQAPFPFQHLALTSYQEFRERLPDLSALHMSLTLSPSIFLQYFSYDPQYPRSGCVEKAVLIDDVHVVVQVLRRREVDPSMVMQPPL